jgi:two-component system, sporulation sensor kinase E
LNSIYSKFITNLMFKKGHINSMLAIISIVLLVPIFLTTIWIYLHIVSEEISERKIQILTVSSQIESTISLPLTNLLTSEGYLSESRQKQVFLQNQILQPLVTEIQKANPKLGVGIYSIECDSIVAIEPNFSTSLLTSVPRDYPYFKSNQTNKPEFIMNKTSIGWNGDSILAVTIPLHDKNKIIGHIWVNLRTNDIYYAVFLKSIKLLALGISIWATIILLFNLLASFYRKKLDRLVENVIRNENIEDTDLFQDLMPILNILLDRTRALHESNQSIYNSQKKLNSVLESISDAFYAVDNNWNITYINKEAQKLLGHRDKTEILGSNLFKVLNKELLNSDIPRKLTECMNTDQKLTYEIQSSRTGHWYENHVYPSPEGLTVYFRDITEKKEIDTQLARLEQLNTIGELAAGISHEIRNPMTTVRGFLQMVSVKPGCTDYKEYFNLMIDELDRANSIITEYLSFSKNHNVHFTLISLNQIIIAILPLLESDALKKEQVIKTNLSELPEIMVDPKEIRQVFFNLVRNGLEAMDKQKKLTITTYCNEQNVFCEITDEGPGIKPDILEKIGTPFYTTKENGTGLGISVCNSILEKHKAKMTIETSAQGTTFRLCFNV